MAARKKIEEQTAAVVEAVEEAAKKVTKAAKTVKESKVQETYFEIGDKQICAEAIVAAVKEAYKAEGNKVSTIKSLKTYINAEEGKAYYVINDVAEGKYIEL